MSGRFKGRRCETATVVTFPLSTLSSISLPLDELQFLARKSANSCGVWNASNKSGSVGSRIAQRFMVDMVSVSREAGKAELPQGLIEEMAWDLRIECDLARPRCRLYTWFDLRQTSFR